MTNVELIKKRTKRIIKLERALINMARKTKCTCLVYWGKGHRSSCKLLIAMRECNEALADGS